MKIIKTLREKILNTDKIKKLSLLLLMFIICHTIGNLLGRHLITKFITEDSRSIFLLLNRPAYEYIHTARMLRSNNDIKRLSGYYSLLDYKKVDAAFLIDSYKREEAIYTKRSIIWLLGYSENRERVLEFLSNEYKNEQNSDRIKREILRTIKRIDKNYFSKFVKSQGIGKKYQEGI